ncbi:MAG: tetratricopeptide repeat protein, partial [Gammaproteobacteria bacterium]|nr:tetratricopeptide repeat protein [Gammaproteobacteria bacterium]
MAYYYYGATYTHVVGIMGMILLYTGKTQLRHAGGARAAAAITLGIVISMQVFSATKQGHRQWKPVVSSAPSLRTQQAGRALHFIENPLTAHPEFSYRSATAAYTFLTYLRLHAVPYPLSSYYGYAVFQPYHWFTWQAWLGLIAGGVVLWLAYFWRKRHAFLSVCCLGFVVCLLPVSNLVLLVAGGIADRLTFSASLFFCLAIGYGIAQLPTKAKYIVFGLLIGMYGVQAYSRAGLWQSRLTLFAHDVQQYPQSAKLQQLTADAYLSKAQYSHHLPHVRAAEEHLRAALQQTEAGDSLYGYHYSLGQALQLQGKLHEATQYYQSAAIHDHASRSDAYFNLGSCYQQLSQPKKAIDAYERYLQLRPHTFAIYANLTTLYHRLQNMPAAVHIATKATHYFPDNADAWFN